MSKQYYKNCEKKCGCFMSCSNMLKNDNTSKNYSTLKHLVGIQPCLGKLIFRNGELNSSKST